MKVKFTTFDEALRIGKKQRFPGTTDDTVYGCCAKFTPWGKIVEVNPNSFYIENKKDEIPCYYYDGYYIPQELIEVSEYEP